MWHKTMHNMQVLHIVVYTSVHFLPIPKQTTHVHSVTRPDTKALLWVESLRSRTEIFRRTLEATCPPASTRSRMLPASRSLSSSPNMPGTSPLFSRLLMSCMHFD